MQPEPEIDETLIPEPVPEPPPARSDRELWLEVVAVVFIGVLPDLWNTVGYLVTKPAGPHSFNAHEAYLVFRSVQVSWLVLYLVSRSQEPWSRFGIVQPRLIRDSLAAFGALMAAYFGYAIYASMAMAAFSTEAVRQDTSHLTELFQAPTVPEQTLLVIVAAALNGFAEELVMRGYLIPRFEHLLGSTAKAVVLSALLFASYHFYQGFFGAGSALVIGLVFGTIFGWTRRLWPVAAAHALLDISSRLG
ncbi:MAG TPA: CPBP family intramembrane glutamic endopeptidase [Thermoanaerobaculia bacterium]|jgi:membrane protease YdiL (CAAX protease family)|nr:CPBP family intramembrane glutamic endopeptidase [Thermoanaerobaculia bacterium]